MLDIIGKVVARLAREVTEVGNGGTTRISVWFQEGKKLCSVVRQLIEKSWEHKSKAFFTFIDLKKAYDSVPRKVMWLALGKLGVPELLVKLISFHEDTKAKLIE